MFGFVYDLLICLLKKKCETRIIKISRFWDLKQMQKSRVSMIFGIPSISKSPTKAGSRKRRKSKKALKTKKEHHKIDFSGKMYSQQKCHGNVTVSKSVMEMYSEQTVQWANCTVSSTRAVFAPESIQPLCPLEGAPDQPPSLPFLSPKTFCFYRPRCSVCVP